jgi:hypothetical protein
MHAWLLKCYRQLSARLQEKAFSVRVARDPDQRDWWLQANEAR